MTVIAYRNGVLAADRCTSAGAVHLIQDCKLVSYFTAERGVCAGSAGGASADHDFLEWVKAGANGDWPRGDDDWRAIVVIREDDQIRAFEYTGDGRFEIPDGQVYALGSGCELALAALDLGCSAAEAALVAARRMGVAQYGIDMVSTQCSPQRYVGDVPLVRSWRP